MTPAFNQTSIASVLPRLALDFTTAVLDSRVTVTRALNTATRVNATGYIQTVNADLPRFDYNPSTLACNGLLIEEARSNLLLYSAQFGMATWTKGGATINVGSVISPDGSATVDKLAETSANAPHYALQTVAVATGAHTASVFVKSAERTWCILEMAGTPFGCGAWFNLSTGAVGTQFGSPTSVAITAAGNGWWRITMTKTASSAVPGIIVVYTATGDNIASYVGTTGSGIYVYGAQLEAGAFATSYIPTVATSLTRNADVVSMTGTNFSSWYNATSGAILARSRQSVITGTRPSIYISDGTTNNIISLRGLAANPELYIKATTDQAQIDAGTLTANSSFGLVGAWTTDNCAAAINGGAAVTDTSATIPTVDQMLIGSDGTNYLNGQVERISYWPQRIINAEAQAFSK
jgi:hypothetical protein